MVINWPLIPIPPIHKEVSFEDALWLGDPIGLRLLRLAVPQRGVVAAKLGGFEVPNGC